MTQFFSNNNLIYNFPCPIQNTDFNQFPNVISQSLDKNYLFLAGNYPPLLKIFDKSKLTQKCSRGLDSTALFIQSLSEDYQKMAVSTIDRNVNYFQKYGNYHKTRVPQNIYNMSLNKFSGELYLQGENSIYKQDLIKGILSECLEQSNESYIRHLKINEEYSLMMVMTESNLIIQDINCGQVIYNKENTFDTFDCQNNSLISCGNSSYNFYDLRFFQKPVETILNRSNFNVKKVILQDQIDFSLIQNNEFKYFNLKDRTKDYSIQQNMLINDFIQEQGIVYLCTHDKELKSYYVEDQNLPEYLKYLDFDENQEESDKFNRKIYKFINQIQVKELNADLQQLKPHLHGYLIELKYYKKLREKSDLFILQEIEKKKIIEEVEKIGNEQELQQELIKINDSRFDKIIKNNKNFQK